MFSDFADPTLYLAAITAAAAAMCIVMGVRTWAERERIGERLEMFVAPEIGLAPATFQEPSFQARAVAPFVQSLAKLATGLLPDRQVERVRRNLAIAGLPYSRHLAQFLAAQVMLAVGMAVLANFYLLALGPSLPMMILMTLLSGVVGFYLPIFWLGRRMGQRKNQILKALPDALDLLSISVSAGLGFDGALLEVVQRWDNPLTQEFSSVLRDMKLGTSRRNALRAFAQRTDVEEVTSFIAAVVQADELGAPMKDVLLIQAGQIRMQRRHKAEERARKATVKMLLPMVFFIFPAMFIVLLGPSLPSFAILGEVGR